MNVLRKIEDANLASTSTDEQRAFRQKRTRRLDSSGTYRGNVFFPDQTKSGSATPTITNRVDASKEDVNMSQHRCLLAAC
jgi:hypothetical protein